MPPCMVGPQQSNSSATHRSAQGMSSPYHDTVLQRSCACEKKRHARQSTWHVTVEVTYTPVIPWERGLSPLNQASKAPLAFV